jgi:ATP-dependent Clp protease ATP-binding subunit ClpX
MKPDQSPKLKKTCLHQNPDSRIGINELHAGAPLLPTPSELIAMLDRKVIGQRNAKQTLAAAAYNHFLFSSLAELTGSLVEPTSVLLIGPTGCGKSHLLKTMRECLGIPMVYLSCTEFTQNGYKGVNINEVLERLEDELLDDNRTQPAIVVWDEIDKLREIPNTHPVSTRGVQQDLLTYLDGTHCGKAGKLDSSRFLNVACGAFVGLDELRTKQGSTPKIGFLSQSDHSDPAETLEPLNTQHLIDFGLIPEFVGRFSAITELAPLDSATLRRILTHAESNPLVAKKRLFEMHGIELIVTDGALDEIIARAVKLGTGARSLRRVLQNTLGRYDCRLPELAAKGVTSLTITAETVKGEKPALRDLTHSPKELVQLIAIRKHAGAYALWKKRSKEESVW